MAEEIVNRAGPWACLQVWLRRLSLVLAVTCLSAEEPADPDAVKAALVPNFFGFIDWSHIPATRDEIVLGVIGVNPLGGKLWLTPDSKPFAGRRVRVVQIDAEHMTACDVVFIGRDVPANDPVLRAYLSREYTLSISDRDDFLEIGGMIKLFQRDKNIKFDIEHTAAVRQKIKISSKLMRLACNHVETAPQKEE